ncbi:MAG: histidine phosphatase family protein [Candidatus Pacebacteria bacterium]|nr:histidine phosphatase family protein [Candidatus Paceibacterota bacterium]
MKIYLVRHGETTSDVENRFGGYYDDYLTEKGKRQAEEMALFMRDFPLTKIFFSPRIRTIKTAKALVQILNVTNEEIVDLRERNTYGVMTGLVKTEAAQKFPEEFEKIQKDNIHHNVRDSEPYEKFTKRVVEAFSLIVDQGADLGHYAVITHGGVIGTIMRDIFNYEKVSIGDCGIIEIEYDKERREPVSIVALREAEIK